LRSLDPSSAFWSFNVTRNDLPLGFAFVDDVCRVVRLHDGRHNLVAHRTYMRPPAAKYEESQALERGSEPASHFRRAATAVRTKLQQLKFQRLVFSFMLVAFLASCGSIGGDGSGSGADLDPESTPVGATPSSGVPMLGPIIWATSIDSVSNRPKTVVTELKDSDPYIYAVVQIVRIAAGTELRADWSFDGNELDELATTLVVDRDLTEGWIEFHLQQMGTDSRPDGVYAVSITSAGAVLAQSEINVVKAGPNS
jgi:hypothetical protein